MSAGVLATSRPADSGAGQRLEALGRLRSGLAERGDRAAIIAARQRLGVQLAGWRNRASLTQLALGAQIGYGRSTVAGAEAGDPASRAFYAAADRVLGAGGRLLAGHDQIEAAVGIARSETARLARAARAQVVEAALAAGPAERDSAAAVPVGCCPCCHTPLTVTVQLAAELAAQFAVTDRGRLEG